MEIRKKNRRAVESLNALVLKSNIKVSPKLHYKDRRIKKNSHLDLVSLQKRNIIGQHAVTFFFFLNWLFRFNYFLFYGELLDGTYRLTEYYSDC